MSENQPPASQPPFHGERVVPNTNVARVPEKVGRGSFATGLLVYTGPQEFVLDFVQALARPPQLVARVVLTPQVLEQFIYALRDNIAKYTHNFGAIAPLPKPPVQERPRSAEEIYADLKIPEDLYSGAYANTVAIRHTPAEFYLDFITAFYPHAAVSSRLYLAPQRVPQVLDTLTGSLQNYQRARGGDPRLNNPLPPAPPAPPAPPSPPPHENN